MVNFYHRSIPSAAKIMKPLYSAVSNSKRDKTLTWTPEMTGAFHSAKDTLANATMLSHPVVDSPISLTTDASNIAIGAVLEQRVGQVWKPLAFFSKQLRTPELKYSTFDRELLALYLSIRHFRFMLEGRTFIAFTDHKPLTFALAKASEPWSARQQRHLAAISEFTTDIRHISGKTNVVAALSRAIISAICDGIDYKEMAREHFKDPEMKDYRTAISGLHLEDVTLDVASGTTVLCDITTGRPRPVVPKTLRRRVFDVIHGLSHPGAKTTRKLVVQKFVWHGLNKQVNTWSRACIQCQASKIQTHIKAPLQTFSVPARRFEHINVDLVGPLPPSQGFTYLLTIVDRFTRWPEAIPLKDCTTVTCARALIANWITRFGVAAEITSDRGVQFTSQLWASIAELFGTRLHHTTAYHPQSNGLVERFHRHLKSSLRARLNSPNWIDELPWVMLGIRTAPKEDLSASSAELVYGAPLTVPGEFIGAPQDPGCTRSHLQQLRDRVKTLAPVPTQMHGSQSHNVPRDILQSKFVFIRKDSHKNPLQRPYDGPYRVLSRGQKTFLVDLGGRPEVISLDRLKAVYTDSDFPVPVAQPKRRGRPSKKFTKDN